jgi:hypothetical protein
VICREYGVSRQVVREVIRSRATEFRYERGRPSLPRIDPRRKQRNELPLANGGKKPRATEADPEFRGAARAWLPGRLRRRAALRPEVARRARCGDCGGLCRAELCAGRGCQFDWSHEVVLINGATVTVKVAHVRPCHSRMLFVRACPRETQERACPRETQEMVLIRQARDPPGRHDCRRASPRFGPDPRGAVAASHADRRSRPLRPASQGRLMRRADSLELMAKLKLFGRRAAGACPRAVHGADPGTR